jgi:hypothetical protein
MCFQEKWLPKLETLRTAYAHDVLAIAELMPPQILQRFAGNRSFFVPMY